MNELFKKGDKILFQEKDEKEWNNVLNPRRCQSLTFGLATNDEIEILDTSIH